jgi:hypothetical protein
MMRLAAPFLFGVVASMILPAHALWPPMRKPGPEHNLALADRLGLLTALFQVCFEAVELREADLVGVCGRGLQFRFHPAASYSPAGRRLHPRRTAVPGP